MARADGDGNENVSTTRPLSTVTTSELAGCDSKTLRVWCPRAAAPGSALNKAGKTPLVPQTGQSNSAELVEKCPPTTRHKFRNAVTTAEVKSPKLQTCDEQQPRGDWSHEPRDLDGRSGPEGVQTQWPGSNWKQGLTTHRTVQAWMDSREKTAREGIPEPKNEKSNHCGKERTYSW